MRWLQNRPAKPPKETDRHSLIGNPLFIHNSHLVAHGKREYIAAHTPRQRRTGIRLLVVTVKVPSGLVREMFAEIDCQRCRRQVVVVAERPERSNWAEDERVSNAAGNGVSNTGTDPWHRMKEQPSAS
jgi:hypothetical protein